MEYEILFSFFFFSWNQYSTVHASVDLWMCDKRISHEWDYSMSVLNRLWSCRKRACYEAWCVCLMSVRLFINIWCTYARWIMITILSVINTPSQSILIFWYVGSVLADLQQAGMDWECHELFVLVYWRCFCEKECQVIVSSYFYFSWSLPRPSSVAVPSIIVAKTNTMEAQDIPDKLASSGASLNSPAPASTFVHGTRKARKADEKLRLITKPPWPDRP